MPKEKNSVPIISTITSNQWKNINNDDTWNDYFVWLGDFNISIDTNDKCNLFNHINIRQTLYTCNSYDK